MTRMRWLRWAVLTMVAFGLIATMSAALAEEQVHVPLVARQVWLDPTATATAITGYVVRIADGDSISVVIQGITLPVRYIGVDTPESDPKQCYYSEAREANKTRVWKKTVQLYPDVELQDDFGRYLYYVHVDGACVNEALIREGYGFASTVPPNVSRARPFLSAEEEARRGYQGMWQACMPARATPSAPAPGGGLKITALKCFGGDEYIRITNTDSTPTALLGWRIQSTFEEIRTFTFTEPIALRPYCSIFVHSGPCARAPSDVDTEPRHVRWQKDYVWNTGRDEAQLLSPGGDIVDTWAYERCPDLPEYGYCETCTADGLDP